MAGNSTWGSHTQVKLQASNKEAGDQFARCDISGDGNVIIVGAPHEAGPTNSLQGSGAVYMFTRSGNTWSEQQIVRPHDPQVDNYFGVDCALNRTGSVAAIAATGDDTTATDSGAVYIFKRIGGTWHQDAKLKASSPVANNSMGSLALSDNGLTLAAGSAGDDTANSPDSGAVFVFTYTGGAWSQTIKLTGSGAGSGDNLGGRTRISGAGNTIVAGARNNDSLASDAGCAYIFTLTGGTWSEALKITSSAGSSGDLLGDSVSISRDGTVICAGSVTADPNSVLDSGSVNVYRGSGGSVSQSTSTASFRIGDTLSIGPTGDIGIQTNDPAFNLDIHGTANVGPLTVSNTFSLSNVATMGTTKTFVVRASGGAYYIDEDVRKSLELHEGQTYIFDISHTSLASGPHPLAFATQPEGANNSEYTTGISSTGTLGTTGAKKTFVVPAGAPTTLYYYCTAHSGMGSTISISPTAELVVSGRVVASGNVEANTFIGDTFIGDGSQLTGISGATTSDLQVVTTNGATTSDAIQLTNTGTSLTASGGITAAYFTGDGSNLTGISSTLQAITDKGNTTSNTIQFTNGFTSLTASGNVLVTGNVTADYFAGDGSNVTIGEMTATAIPYVDANKQLRDSYITRTIDTTTITSNLRVEGNLVVTGTSYAVDSENMVINDRIIGLANNNTTTTLDTGLMLQYPQKNVAIIHHGTVSGSPHNGQLTIGYTQNTFVHDNIVHDANNITLNVIGHVITQNNITVGAQGSYYGDGTTLTGVALSADLSDNVTRIEDLETATIISNSSGITTGFTRGDIIYASADNVLNKLAIGTSGQVLKSDGTDVVWGTDGGGGGSGSTVWQTNGNKIYYSADNVGINVSDPAFDLDVHGTANVGALTATSLSVGGQTLALASDLSANATRVDALYTATAGDIIYATGTNTLGKLGIGAPGEVLTVVNGFPAWAAATGGGGGGTSSQWTTVNTNEIYYDGNVGIANTDPGHDLSVGSNLYVDDDASNVLVVTGNTAMSSLTLGEVSIVASYGLSEILNVSNTSSNIMQLTDATTGLVATGNVHALAYHGDGTFLTGLNLEHVANEGNATSNTVRFTNTTTGLVTTANAEVGGELTVSGNATVSSNLTVNGHIHQEDGRWKFDFENRRPARLTPTTEFRYVVVQGTSDLPSGSQPNTKYVVPDSGTTVYQYTPSTDTTTTLISSTSSADTVGSIALTAGTEIFTTGAKPFVLSTPAYNHAVIPFACKGYYFGFTNNRMLPTTIFMYAPYEDVTVNLYLDKSITETPTETFTLTKQTVVTRTINPSVDDYSYTIEAVNGVIMASRKGQDTLGASDPDGDHEILYPASNLGYNMTSSGGSYYNHDVFNTGGSAEGMWRFSSGVVQTGPTFYSPAGIPHFSSCSGDGDGGDTTSIIPHEIVGEVYYIPHIIAGFMIGYLTNRQTVTVDYYHGGTWYNAHTLTGPRYGVSAYNCIPYRAHTVGSRLDGGRSALSGNMLTSTLWKFTSDHPFVLRTETMIRQHKVSMI